MCSGKFVWIEFWELGKALGIILGMLCLYITAKWTTPKLRDLKQHSHSICCSWGRSGQERFGSVPRIISCILSGIGRIHCQHGSHTWLDSRSWLFPWFGLPNSPLSQNEHPLTQEVWCLPSAPTCKELGSCCFYPYKEKQLGNLKNQQVFFNSSKNRVVRKTLC